MIDNTGPQLIDLHATRVKRLKMRAAEKMGGHPLAPPSDKAVVKFQYGDRHYVMGEWCNVTAPNKDGEDDTLFIGQHIWPVAAYVHQEKEVHGVIYFFKSGDGFMRRGFMEAAAFTHRNAARKAGEAAANAGAMLAPGNGERLAEALGVWRATLEDDDIHTTITQVPGWHQSKDEGAVYVNGKDQVFGSLFWAGDDTQAAIEKRSQRMGTLDGWKAAVKEQVTTPGLRAVLGVSLAGPLPRLLVQQTFGVHVCGSSSSGKTTAAVVAASVWGIPDPDPKTPNAFIQQWSTTVAGFENISEMASGACLVLDELGKSRESKERLSNIVYDIMGGQGRVRSTPSGQQQHQRTWSVTVVSTGEISMRDKIGDEFKGGHGVRMIDISAAQGELTTSAEHSKNLQVAFKGSLFSSGQYGHASDAWIEHLMSGGRDSLPDYCASIRESVQSLDDGSPESGRILDSISMVGAALLAARDAELVDWSDAEILDAVHWLGRKALENRAGMTTPNERMLSMFYDLIDTEPRGFPTEKTDHVPAKVFGYRRKIEYPEQPDDEEIWTSENMISAAGLPVKAGVGVRDWMAWCVKEGHCRDEFNKRIAGKQRAWKVFPLSKNEEKEE